MTGQRENGLQALRLFARGWQGPEIAVALGITEGAIRSRMKRLFRQLGARTTAQAIVIAAIDGLLTREDLRAAYEDRRIAGEGEG